jgi:hypothetical protein
VEPPFDNAGVADFGLFCFNTTESSTNPANETNGNCTQFEGAFLGFGSRSGATFVP